MENNAQEIREKIFITLKIKGPCLPVHISKETGLSILFASAFLSELASEKTVKISNLKVGGSPLYFLPGHEEQLEKYCAYLVGKEKEAFLLLKGKQLLQDEIQEPAVRVALRSLKDFAFPLTVNLPDSKKTFWRFYSLAEDDAKKRIEEIVLGTKKEKLAETKEAIKLEEKFPEKIQLAGEKSEEKPLIALKERITKHPETQKIREKSEFVSKIINFLNLENIEVVEEKEFKKKEYLAVIRINSDIGKIRFLCIAKDKKSITENDLALAFQNSQALKMPVFFLSSGNLNKKAQSYLEQNSNFVKFRRI